MMNKLKFYPAIPSYWNSFFSFQFWRGDRNDQLCSRSESRSDSGAGLVPLARPIRGRFGWGSAWKGLSQLVRLDTYKGLETISKLEYWLIFIQADSVMPPKHLKTNGLKIFQRYHFSSALKRMTVIAGYQTNPSQVRVISLLLTN